jgi:hypothetical protein
MFRTDLLSIIRSLDTVFTAIGICRTSYVDCWPRYQTVSLSEIVHLVGFYYMNRILIGKLPAADIDKILPPFYVIQRFIAALTTVRHSVTFYDIVFYNSKISPTPPNKSPRWRNPLSTVRDSIQYTVEFGRSYLAGTDKTIMNFNITKIRSPYSMWNDYFVPIIYEIPVTKYKTTSNTCKATKYTFMWPQNTLMTKDILIR